MQLSENYCLRCFKISSGYLALGSFGSRGITLFFISWCSLFALPWGSCDYSPDIVKFSLVMPSSAGPGLMQSLVDCTKAKTDVGLRKLSPVGTDRRLIP